MKNAVLSMGLPGAGKSTVIAREFNASEFTTIDPDQIKAEKADYDPKRPEVYHAWSTQEAKARISRAIANGENVIIDGTGTHVETMYRKIKELQGAGYHVTLLYVRVSLQTSLRRNAERERNVPESVIREKNENIASAFEILSGMVDEVRVINND
jgi:predicted kinase